MSIGWVDAPVTSSSSNASVATNEGIVALDAAFTYVYAAVVGGASATWHWTWVTPDYSSEPPIGYSGSKLEIRCNFFSPPIGVLTITADGHGETLTLGLLGHVDAAPDVYGTAAYSTDANDGSGGGGGPSLPPITAPFIVHLADGFTIDEASVFARPEMATGHSRLRRARTVPERSVDIAWLLTDAQMAQADDFYENALQAGHGAFAVPVKRQQSAEINTAAVSWWAAKWAAPPRCEPRRGGLWHYGGTLRLFGEPQDTPPEPTPLGAAFGVALYGSAALTAPQTIAAAFGIELLEQRSLGQVGFAVALTE